MEFSFGALKKLILPLIMLFSISLAGAASNIVDVQVTEDVYEVVNYDPQTAGSGLYFDSNENQSVYTLSGTIFVENPHLTEPVENVVLNFSPISNIYNVSFSSGSTGYVTEFNVGGDYMILTIPDLGSGSNTTFTYNINASNVAPPINFTTGYSDSKIFAGLPITVTDNVQNVLNSTNYPNNCIYNISIVQNALAANSSGSLFNFTYDSSSIAGSDSSNVSFSGDNRTLSWDLWNLGCFNSGNVTDINYDVNTPSGVTVASTYEMINTSISYRLNSTVSRMSLVDVVALLDLDIGFEKYLNQTLSGDNATWEISAFANNPTDVDVNLTEATLWVSVRNGTGTGFTNPSIIDNDTVSGAQLNTTYSINQLINTSTGQWNNSGNEWLFNYTFSSSPIVWMDVINEVVNDGVQMTNRSVSYGQNSIYIKEIYLATGYWLQITKNITRLSEGNFSIFIKVKNLGTSPTPSSQVVMVYNFIPISYNLTSSMVFSSSSWYNTSSANESLSDPVYNGTMFQFGIIPDGNPFDSSLDAFGGSENLNNTWTLTYNISGSGEFDFEDLFLTGVDPLNVQEYGATKALTVEAMYGILSAKVEYFLVGIAAAVGMLLLLF